MADNKEAVKSASIVLVVNKQNNISALTKKEVIDIYMGRFKTFPNGQAAIPIDFPQGSSEKRQFYKRLVGKDERKIKAYWSRLLFSGRAKPPAEVEPEKNLIALVSKEVDVLAYMRSSSVTPEMKIVYAF